MRLYTAVIQSEARGRSRSVPLGPPNVNPARSVPATQDLRLKMTMEAAAGARIDVAVSSFHLPRRLPSR